MARSKITSTSSPHSRQRSPLADEQQQHESPAQQQQHPAVLETPPIKTNSASGQDSLLEASPLDNVDRAAFYRERYLAAVESADTLRHELSIAQSHVEEIYNTKRQMQDTLRLVENQCMLYKQANERSVNQCQGLEEDCKRLRKELIQTGETVERYKGMNEKLRRELNVSASLIRDLQGKISSLQGTSSVSFVPSLAEYQQMQARLEQLDQENTDMKMSVGQRAAEWGRQKGTLIRERDDALAELERWKDEKRQQDQERTKKK